MRLTPVCMSQHPIFLYYKIILQQTLCLKPAGVAERFKSTMFTKLAAEDPGSNPAWGSNIDCSEL